MKWRLAFELVAFFVSYGIIFALSTLVWVGLQGAHGDWSVVADYWPFLLGLMLVAGMPACSW